jgi:hypothetical protein
MITDTKEFALPGFGECPVFTLNADLQPRADCPSDFKICVAVDSDDGPAFALASEVETLRRYLTLERAA